MEQHELKWTIDPSRNVVALTGYIDELCDLSKLESDVKTDSVTLDLAAIKRINSLGVRQWIRLMHTFRSKQVTLRRCSPAIVEQLNCIREFRAHAQVKSILLPYICEKCGALNYVEMDTSGEKFTALPPGPPCEKCQGVTLFDDLPDRYLSFVKFK